MLVCYDFLGMYTEVRPKFVRRFAELGDAVIAATRTYVSEVRASAFPGVEHSFGEGTAKPKALAEGTGARPVVDEVAPSYGPASDERS